MSKMAIISVSDKTGIEHFARELQNMGIQIISTGGTASFLKKNGISVTKVSEITGFPEILEGRVKTLHPKIHGGILAKRTDKQKKELITYGIDLIDFVIVNLYPFWETVAKRNISDDEVIEYIDIGGPAMLRAAAKNYTSVVPIVDASDYPEILEMLKKNGKLSLGIRQELAYKTFQHTASYDVCISRYFQKEKTGDFPKKILFSLGQVKKLRYGENPHQEAALYGNILNSEKEYFPLGTKQIWGKDLSYNNILDVNSVLDIVFDFLEDDFFSVIVKHGNPCGASIRSSAKKAYLDAIRTDSASSFGGIVGFNSNVDTLVAKEMEKSFLECIVAPSFSDEAKSILMKKKNVRLLVFDKREQKDKQKNIKSVRGGGFLIQTSDQVMSVKELASITGDSVSEEIKESLEFAWRLVKHVKSNAILLAKEKQLIGVGAGQMSRIDAVSIAKMKAKQNEFCLKGSVLSSDAFFPFRDSIDTLSSSGLSAIIQPGGSVRDKEVIDAAKEHKIAMFFTGRRHFNH